MHKRLRFAPLPIILLAAILAGGCEPTAAALPRLSDPVEILDEALRTTAELDYVHARVEAQFSMPDFGQGQFTYVVDTDIDLGRRELHVVADVSMALTGSQRIEALLVGTDMFVRGDILARADGSNRWQRTAIAAGSDPRAAIPPNPAIAELLSAMFEDPSVAAELKGVESCGEAQCYHVVATVAPELIWRLANGALFGSPPGQDAGPVDPAIPAVTLDVMVDESSRRLMSVATDLSYENSSTSMTATFSNHDVEFRLLAPPPDQVEDASSGLGGWQEERILEEVGERSRTAADRRDVRAGLHGDPQTRAGPLLDSGRPQR